MNKKLEHHTISSPYDGEKPFAGFTYRCSVCGKEFTPQYMKIGLPAIKQKCLHCGSMLYGIVFEKGGAV